MRLKLLIATTLISFCGAHAQNFNQSQWLWSAVTENSGLQENQPQGFVDRYGNYIMLGNFRTDTATIQGTTIQNTSDAAAPVKGDAYIAKFDTNGVLLNVKHFSGSKYEQFAALAYDGNDHYYAIGSYNGNMQIGTTTLTNPNTYGDRSFIVKFTLDANPVWIKEFPEYMGGGYLQYKNNYLYLAANYSSDQLSFEGQTLPMANYAPTIQGMDKNLVAKFDANTGNLIWVSSSRYTGTTSSNMSDRIGAQMKAMVVDNNGNVYIAGDFLARSVTFGNITLNRSSSSNAGLFYVRYDNTGAVAWAKTATVGPSSDTKAYNLAVDSANNVYLVGMAYNSTINFDGTILQFPGNYGGYMVKHGTAGNLIWAKKAGISTDQAPGTNASSSSKFSRLYIDAQDNIYVGGNFYRYVNLSPDFTYTIDNNFFNFIAKYNAQGTVQACEIYPAPANGSSNLKVLDSDPDNFTIISTASVDIQLNNLNIVTNDKQSVYIAKTGESALGLAEFGTANFAVYPNPASERLFIKNKEQLSDQAQIAVYDLNGRQIFKVTGATIGEKGIEVSKLAAGIYVLGIEDASQQLKEYQKFVKNK